jgi:hypothetical protein
MKQEGFKPPKWLFAEELPPIDDDWEVEGIPPWMLKRDQLPKWFYDVLELPRWVLEADRDCGPNEELMKDDIPEWLKSHDLPEWLSDMKTEIPQWLLELDELPNWMEDDLLPSWASPGPDIYSESCENRE